MPCSVCRRSRWALRKKALRLLFAADVFQDGQVVGFHGPARLAQEGDFIRGPGESVQHQAVGRAKVAGDVAALFLVAGDAEGADTLKR